MLRIGRIGYANCTPIFWGLQQNHPNDDFQFLGGVPARLNAMLAAGEIDVCPSSSVEYALHPGRYLIMPHLSISSVGAVKSVLLFSRVPLEKLDGQRILLSSESATSVNLLKILLEKRFGLACTYAQQTSPFYQALSEAPALLLIGDAALRASAQNSDLLVYDLGQLWYQWTGLPFVFALWLCRREVVEDRSAEVANLASQLAASKELARINIQTIAENTPEAEWMGTDRLIAYWRDNISYDLDDAHLKGLILFYRYCAELTLIAAEPDLYFLTDSSTKER